MKKEDLYNAISDVRSEYLEEADAYKPSSRIRWKKWIAAAACFCLMAAGAFSLFPRQNSVLPLAITAYAMDDEGILTGTPIELHQMAPMTQLELSTGKGGFLFSVDLGDENEESQINPFVLVEGSRSAEIEEVIEKYTEPKGKAYFYFVPDQETNEDGTVIGVTCYYTKANGSTVAYGLQIMKDHGEFTAALKSVDSFPVYDPNLPVEENTAFVS